MKKWVKKKTFWMLRNLTKRWYLYCHKHYCHKSQCISKYLFPWKHLSYEREFNNLITALKPPRRQIKDSWYLEAATESHLGILSFLSKSLSNTYEFIFGNVAGYRPALLLKKELSGICQGIFLKNQLPKLWSSYFEGNLYNQNTSSGCFCLCQQFLKNRRRKNIKSMNREF